MRCIGISKRELLNRLGGPNVLLNLAYSIHPPLLLKFDRRLFCDLDPSEIFYWMTKMEMGQSYHHEFWTIGLNVHGNDCQLPKAVVAAAPDAVSPSQATRLPLQKLQWKTFYPLVDTTLFRPKRWPSMPKFTTVGQWYWSGAVDFRNKTIKNYGQKFTLRLLQKLANRDTVTLLCHCAEDEAHCHRHVLAEILNSKV
jgi:hypothetical protein